ncbi:MAG: ABC transporter permease [Chitinophagales bacterium]
MIFKIAWRNIWRNKVRSLILILSIVLGIWAGAFVMSFYWGMSLQQVEQTIASQLAHFQIHHPAFKENFDIKYTIPDAENIISDLQSNAEIKAYSERLVAVSMIASANASRGIMLYGVDPLHEDAVTGLKDRMVEGQYLDDSLANRVIIGQGLAEKLKVKVNNKLVFTFQDATGEIIAAAFRISGLYRSNNSMIEESVVYTEIKSLRPLLGISSGNHEIAVLLKDAQQADLIALQYVEKYPDAFTETWKQIAPELRMIIESFSQYMYIIIFIILIALIFGIVNTMLMAIMERTRELGVLMAVGMNRKRIFSMILVETMMLGCIGGPLGLLLAFTTTSITAHTGINLAMFTEGFERYGYSAVVYPQMEVRYYFEIFSMVIIAALISALFPAWRALKLKPVTAIRKI